MGSSSDPKKGEFEGTAGETTLLVIVSFFLPPLGVALLRGFGAKVIITFLLTLLAYIPGIIYAELEIAIWFADRRDQRKKDEKKHNQAIAAGQMAQQQNGYPEPTYNNYQQPPPQQWQGQPGPYPPQAHGGYNEMPAPPQSYNPV